jgi:hypothetical protein
MKVKAMRSIRDAIPTLTEMKKRLQQARLDGGDIPKVPTDRSLPPPSSIPYALASAFGRSREIRV